MAETKQENQETAEEPAQSPVERVTEKVKDPKKLAAGRAGAAARKAKQERLLKQLRGAKESFRPPAGDGTPANIPPKEADSKDQEQAVSRPERREGLTNWTPWIVGACHTGGALVFLRNAQTKSPAPKQPMDRPAIRG